MHLCQGCQHYTKEYLVAPECAKEGGLPMPLQCSRLAPLSARPWSQLHNPVSNRHNRMRTAQTLIGGRLLDRAAHLTALWRCALTDGVSVFCLYAPSMHISSSSLCAPHSCAKCSCDHYHHTVMFGQSAESSLILVNNVITDPAAGGHWTSTQMETGIHSTCAPQAQATPAGV